MEFPTDPYNLDQIEVGDWPDEDDEDDDVPLLVRGVPNDDRRRLYSIDFRYEDDLAPDAIDRDRYYGYGEEEPPAEWEIASLPDEWESKYPVVIPRGSTPIREPVYCSTCLAKPPVSNGECDTCRKYRQRHKGKPRPMRLAQRQGGLNGRRKLQPGERIVTPLDDLT